MVNSVDYKDYYKLMGVERDASQDEIKRAYRKLARKYHPDVSKETDAELRFKELGEAYAVLKDPEKRAAYDELGADWKAGQEFRPPPDWGAGFEFSGRAGMSPASPSSGLESSNIEPREISRAWNCHIVGRCPPASSMETITCGGAIRRWGVPHRR